MAGRLPGLSGKQQTRKTRAFGITADVCYLDWAGLTGDVFVSLSLLAAFAAIVERRRRRRQRFWQFTIGDLLVAILLLSIPLESIAQRRNAFANAISAAEGADGLGSVSFELMLPTWLGDIIDGWGVDDIWASLGWLRAHDATFHFPEDQKYLEVVRALVELDPENIHVMFTCVRRTPAHGSITTAELAALRSLNGLRNLTLNGADDSVMACLDSLPNLRSLTIDEQSSTLTAEGVAHLSDLSQLRYLHAWPRCLGDEGMAVVQSLRSLEGLSLPGASGRDIACLANLNHLRWLNLPNTTATDIELAPLAKLTRLERLHLSGYRINGAGLASLSSLARLWSLDLSRCGLSNEGLAAIGKLKSLRDLDLTETPITGGLGHLAPLGRLQRLDLSFTEISDAGLAEFPALA
ncbi:MAG TPA: hypothetical protein VFI31_06385 [Pirellulales bacterium]|nr:hypothetical protein [Pirellulales bacterium]